MRRSKLLSSSWFVGLGVLVAACGGPSAEDLFDDGGSADGSDADDSDADGNAAGGASSTGGNNSTGGSSTGGSSTGGSSSGGSSSGGTSSTGGSSTGGMSSTGGNSSTTSSSSGVVSTTMECGNSSCPVENNSACCWDNYGLNGAPQAECVTGPQNNNGCNNTISNNGLETEIYCQLPSHCDSGICCAFREFFSTPNGQSAFYSELSCVDNLSQCEWSNIVMCDPDAPNCPVVTVQGQPTQTVCKQSSLLPDEYAICGLP